jgi:hypothetical protein
MNEHREHAAFRARHSVSRIGAAVVEFAVGSHGCQDRWSCVVSDGDAYRYVDVCSDEFGPWERLPPPVVEEAIERFAASLPNAYRLYHLVNTNPIHLSRDGVAQD